MQPHIPIDKQTPEEFKALERWQNPQQRPHIPWDLKQYNLARWLLTNATWKDWLRMIGKLIKWPVKFMVLQYPKTRLFFGALLGGRATPRIYQERQTICANCEFLQTKSRGRSYCGVCNCPKWLLSRLTFKNKLLRWYCPKQKHPGVYPEYLQLLYRPPGGCKGCGRK